MRRGPILLVLLAALAVPAIGQPATMLPATMLDVAPTTLELKTGVAGLLYVTNHGAHPVMVQVQAMDWRQQDGHDQLSPGKNLLVSPPMVRVAPGIRQSVRVMARGTAGGARAFRLLVSQLPDAGRPASGVQVLLQFSVPVFVDRAGKVPAQLYWRIVGGHLHVRNTGSQAVKLVGLAVNGVPRGGLFYLLPGSGRDLGVVTDPVHVSVRDGRTGHDLAVDVAP